MSAVVTAAGRPRTSSGAIRAARQRTGLLAVAIVSTLPAWAMVRIYTDARVLPLGAGAAALAVAVSYLAHRRGAGLVASVAVSATAFAVYSIAIVAAPTGRSDLPDPASARVAFDGVVHGWARLLTSPLPVGVDPNLLMPAIALVWISAAAGAELALRTPDQLSLIGPATVALVASSVLAGGREAPAGALALAYLVGAALLLRTRSANLADDLPANGAPRAMVEPIGPGVGGEPDPGISGGRAGPGGGVFVALALSAVLAIAYIGGPQLVFGRDKHQYDPRQHFRQAAKAVTAISPLDLISTRLQHPDVPMFSVRSTEQENWQQTVLDYFDGYDWSTSSTYVGGGSQVPAPPATGVKLTGVTQQFSMEQLSGPWLPAAIRPASVRGAAFRADPESGALEAVSGTATGARYSVTSEVPTADPAALLSANVAVGQLATLDTVLPPGLPAVLAKVARAAVGPAETPFSQALLLERYLRLDYHIDPKAGAGHSYAKLVQFLTVTKAGTSEQFATAFAVLGRVLGLPTRVAVGFSSGKLIGADDYQVDSGDVQAWPEVDFSGIGWVPFDPTPAASDHGSTGGLPVGASGGPGRQTFIITGTRPVPTAPQPPPVTSPPKVAAQAPAPRATGGSVYPLVVEAVAVALVAVGALAMAGALMVARAKRTRLRTRRRSGGPRQRIAGAWAETLDRLAEAGVRGMGTLTVAEVIAAGDAALGERAKPLTGMYRPVNEALYNPQFGDDVDAERVWRNYDRFVVELAKGRSRLRRAIFAFDPRPLRRTRPPNYTRRPRRPRVMRKEPV